MKEQHFGTLDLYRFIAALGVATNHFTENAKYDLSSGVGYAFGDFSMFVDFFFILSGFVIGINYSERVATVPQSLTFFRRRFARLYPLYLLTLLIIAVPAALGFNKEQFRGVWSVLQDLLLIKSWPLNAEMPYNFPAWSVSVEWAMYLLFPAIMLLARRAGNLAIVLLIIIGYGLVEYVMAIGAVKPPLWEYDLSPIRALPSFCAGILISQTFRAFQIPNAKFLGVAAFVVSVSLVVVHANNYLVLSLFAATIFVTANGYLSGIPSMFDNRLCLALGNASYSVYMLHAIFLSIFVGKLWPKLFSGPPPLWYGALLTIPLVITAILTFKLFEKPARDLINGRRVVALKSASVLPEA